MSSAEISQTGGMALLARARLALRRHFALPETAGAGPQPPPLPDLRRRRGAFVSLHGDEGLRGCIGAMEPDRALAELVDELAVAAATRDPRFSSLAAAELDAVRIEISVLTPPVAVGRAADVRVGQHGLMVARGARRGVLLPQVAVEHGWDAAAFLGHTCIKAGLEADAWRAWDAGQDSGLQVQVFSAQLFCEPPR